MKKKISIGVSEFALPSPRKGSIDAYSGFTQGQTFGIQIHQEVQLDRSKKYSCYESEVWTVHKFHCDKFIFEVSGKMDGIYHQENFKIEEIKTAFDFNKLLTFLKDNEEHPYSLQLKTYGYIYWLKTKKIPDLTLHLISSRNKKSTDFNITLNLESYERWLSCRLKELVEGVKLTEKIIKQRKKTSKSITFPFSLPRPGQKELIESVNQSMKQHNHMLIQAPTGLGKTMGILFPTLIESLKRGQKVIYLTPKNSQHLVALDAINNLQKSGGKIKCLALTAKKKICMKQEPICNAEYCEFAENHYTKISKHNLLNKLKKERKLTAYAFKKMAEEYKVCPYELQMEMVTNVETIICDYNYVFSPQSLGSRVAKMRLGEVEKPNIIIDELHNLPARSMDYYSPGLSVLFFEKISRSLEAIPIELREKFLILLQQCISIIQNCAPPNKKGPQLIDPPLKLFTDHEVFLQEFLSSYLESDAVIGHNDVVLNVYNYWTEFTAALKWTTLDNNEFFTTYYPEPPTVKITCCDASEMLKSCYNLFSKVIGFSATLKPFDFYSQLVGLNSPNLKTSEFFSPFPKEYRKILIIPQISSKYSERSRNYPRIAEVIMKISRLKKGNYFSFFPSFEFMEKVLEIFQLPQGFNILKQERGMRQEHVQKIINTLNKDGSSYIVFAVQGGVFSEGIDYPGKIAIGAFVVGAPLPIFDWERIKMEEYYQLQYSKGEEYAYIYPAMAKAIQAAGRVIRSELDKGIIVLMDNRFLRPDYSQCMPQDWFKDDPNEIVSKSILNDVTKFWELVDS